MTSPFDRRAFLRRAGVTGAAAAAMATGLPRPPARADESLAPFLHGVASGDPLPDRVILWTRVTPQAGRTRVPVRWTVARDPGLTDVVATGRATATAERDFTVKIDPVGLASRTTYYYAFEALGRWSAVGRTRTAPSPGQSVDRLRFGVVSCSNLQAGFFNAYARLAERNDLDAIIHLGDYLYEYADGGYGPGAGELSGPRPIEPAHEIVTLDDYRARHASYKLDPDLRRLHQLNPFVVTWDDHETTNNSYRDGAENHQPDTEGSWEARLGAAARAYDEWMPVRLADPLRLYRSLPYGGLVDLLVLDTRIEGRDEPAGTPASDAALSDPERQLISEAQRTWLYGQLTASQERGTAWRIIPQQVMLMPWNAVGAPRIPGPDTPSIVRDGGVAFNGDAWDGYTAERDRLFDHVLERDIEDVVVLTGDIHTSWAADLTRDPYDPTVYDPTGQNPVAQRNVGVEFVTPSVTSANFESVGEEPSRAAEVGILATHPHIKMVELTGHGFNILDVTPERVQSDWFFVDTVLEPSDAERHFDSWRVDRGTHRLVHADGPVTEQGRAAPLPGGEPARSEPAASSDDPRPGRSVVAPALPTTGAGSVLPALSLIAGAGALRLRDRRPDGDQAAPPELG